MTKQKDSSLKTDMKDCDSLLWHFTKAEFLESFFKNGFYATNAAYYESDKTDCLIRREWQAALSDCFKLAFENSFGVLHNVFDMFKQEKVSKNVFAAFCVCFCEKPIFDYMWDGYAQGGGYAIGVDRRSIEQLANDENIFLQPCKYSGFEQEMQKADRITSSIGKLCSSIKRGSLQSRNLQIATKLVKTINFHSKRAAFIKKEEFILDQEWRLLWLPSNRNYHELQFSKDGLHCFVKPIGEPKNYVRHILVSPKGGTELLTTAKSLAKQFGIPETKIETFEKSTIMTDNQIFGNQKIKDAYESWLTRKGHIG